MPPALEPLDAQIMDAIEARLSSTIVSGVEYWTDGPEEISQSPINYFDATCFPTYNVVQGDWRTRQQPIKMKTVFMEVGIVVIVNDDDPKTVLRRHRHDIIKAINQDETFGGLVVDVDLVGSEIIDLKPAHPLGVLVMNYDVHFRYHRLDPTLVG